MRLLPEAGKDKGVFQTMAQIFRSEALKKLRDPEQLDTVIKLTTPRGWMSLYIVLFIVVALIVWGFLGGIPSRVSGLGMIRDSKSVIYDVSATAEGWVEAVHVKIGDRVIEGDKIVTLRLPDTETKKKSALTTLEILRQQYDEQSAFTEKDVSGRAQNTEKQVSAMQESIKDTQQELNFYRDLYKVQEDELKKGYITRQTFEQTKVQISTAEQTIRDTRNKILQARTDQVEFKNDQKRTLAQMEQQIVQAENTLKEIETTLDTEKVITSPVEGRVTEIDTKLNAQVGLGAQLAVIQKSGEELIVTAFFQIGKGKKVLVGMKAEISPASVERDIYGVIRGRVTAVSELPESQAGIMEIFGNLSVAEDMMKAGPPLKITIELDEDPKTFSGLKWSSSKGPPVIITPGTTAFTTITVEEKRPIDYVIPIYETWLGHRNSEDDSG
ncbi:MAG: NHLP bacteriocin system secretion protein [Rhodospirillaceae bacterium]|nr:NHLP bacteriocin system secretion protein [Rhodospirillaceae bacterium]MBT5374464.1 NHLP bacteriocin system secretion protein [Rhodospirillaceae bacterium]MBT5751273.1 NHLP bacteriocin system secretion protein [Rhodospirillaceae bacterium]